MLRNQDPRFKRKRGPIKEPPSTRTSIGRSHPTAFLHALMQPMHFMVELAVHRFKFAVQFVMVVFVV